MIQEPTYLQKVLDETVRPVAGALDLLQNQIEETMNLPTSPWKVLNKPYKDLSIADLTALMDIYHTPGEVQPCPMCLWMSREERMIGNKLKSDYGG